MIEGFLAPRYLGWLLDGFVVTVALSVSASGVALALAAVLCVLRLSPARPFAAAAAGWLSIFRNTPLLVQLFVWYFGVSALLPDDWMTWLNRPHRLSVAAFGLSWPSFEVIAGFVGLTLYTSAFMAEELRAGVNGVPAGQKAAARALGLTDRQVWGAVILPQAARISIGPLAGQVMNAAKNSSLAMTIGLAELSYRTRQVETETFQAFQAFGVATVLYVAFVAVIELASRLVQRRMAAARR